MTITVAALKRALQEMGSPGAWGNRGPALDVDLAVNVLLKSPDALTILAERLSARPDPIGLAERRKRAEYTPPMRLPGDPTYE